MNKEQLGRFIGEERKALGLTQRELAERLHVTDKAVSKWERAMSYPDVTLLEPLAAVLELRVEELMACRKDPAEREEEPVMKNLLTISSESLRAERRRGWSRLAAVLALLLAAGLTVLYAATFQTVTDKVVFHLKETVEGETYLYLEERGNADHLLKLRCGAGVEPAAISLTDGRDRLVYRLTYRWNRWTREGVVTACEPYAISLGTMMDIEAYEPECAPLFGHPQVFYARENFYPDPYAEERGRVFLCDVRFWIMGDGTLSDPKASRKTILAVEDCLSAAAADVDGDGENEAVIRTRWAEKPYIVYDLEAGEVTETWPDTVPEEIRQLLRCECEWE